jgi:uncharacterized repeat protein (TIGR01451 family)
MKSNKRVLPLCILCLILLAGVAATAQQTVRPEVKLSLVGLVQRGNEAVPVEKAGQVNPGEIVSYTITAANAGTGPAREVRPFANIPPGTVFVAGSARAEGNAEIAYSIDGGKTFHATPLIEVRQPDGTIKKVPAPVTLYTQVRYDWNDPLAPGGRFTASYKVRVK